MQDNSDKKYRALEQIHHQALHELADAVQIIKSYEFLHKIVESENALLRVVVARAEELFALDDFGAFYDKAAELRQAMQEYHATKKGGFAKHPNPVSFSNVKATVSMN